MSDLPDDGFLVRPNSARKKPLSKDPNPEWFWAEYADILQISATKQQNPKWGARRISEFLHIDASEKKIKKILENYFFDACVGSLYRASKDNTVPHRRAVKKEELIKLIQKKHEIDHRRPDAIYESIRRSVFPVVRENVQLLYKQEVFFSLLRCKIFFIKSHMLFK